MRSTSGSVVAPEAADVLLRDDEDRRGRLDHRFFAARGGHHGDARELLEAEVGEIGRGEMDGNGGKGTVT
jgi:hypothetical protein